MARFLYGDLCNNEARRRGRKQRTQAGSCGFVQEGGSSFGRAKSRWTVEVEAVDSVELNLCFLYYLMCFPVAILSRLAERVENSHLF